MTDSDRGGMDIARTANRWKETQKKEQEVNTSIRKISRVGCYARLSHNGCQREAWGEMKTDSLENQKRMMLEYIESHGDLHLIHCFQDEGKTGTDFQREGFQSLMAAIQREEIDCVMVKDLSRFARNAVEASDYLEKIFPLSGVRFISVLDDYDSLNPNCSNQQLSLYLKNMVHAMYAVDISRKIHATVQLKQSRGECMGGNKIPYGYQLKRGEKFLSPDISAVIVQRMFAMASAGCTSYTIAKELTSLFLHPPAKYRRTGELYGKREEGAVWYASTVDHILTNPVYTGDTYYHKTGRERYQHKVRIQWKLEEWNCVKNTHEAIIEREKFQQIQRMRKARGLVHSYGDEQQQGV